MEGLCECGDLSIIYNFNFNFEVFVWDISRIICAKC
jgi:hypothetical protein